MASEAVDLDWRLDGSQARWEASSSPLGASPAANIGDRDAAAGLLTRLRRLHRDITLVWADG
ncbi:hypothetical protein ACFV2T_40530, partial [Streptomyces sp. NPDC059651]